MKLKIRILCGAALLCIAVPTFGQNPAVTTPQIRDESRDRMPVRNDRNQLGGVAKASDLMGMTVKNLQNEKLGKIEELAIDLESGRIVEAIVSTGGFLGIGDRLTAVPPGAFRFDPSERILRLDADKSKLRGAPAFDDSKWAEEVGSNRLSAVYAYYGQETAFNFIDQTESTVETTRNPNRRTSHDRQWHIPASRLAHLQKASKVIGTSIKNQQNETLGKIDNLLIDLSSGRIVAAVFASGGFLGMGSELSAVPPTVLRYNDDRDTILLDSSKEALSRAPHFKSTEWPDFAKQDYAESVYRAYNVPPYFGTNYTADSDSTVRKVRDRNDDGLTSLDQGNSKEDINTTAEIRKEIVSRKDMSVNARNVKIITNHGRVTLRGRVNSADEKRSVGEIANRVARSENVDNQLEVKDGPNE